MRYSPEHKAEVRARIVQAASRALRRDGLHGVGIPGLMGQVGLTHGGFYAHFQDRDELVAEAVRLAARQTGAGVFEQAATLEEALQAYTSRDHVNRPEGGCVVAALGAEAPRQSPQVRSAFAFAARGLLALVQRRLAPDNAAQPLFDETLSDEALDLTSRMVGAVILARLVEDPALADRLLQNARRR